MVTFPTSRIWVIPVKAAQKMDGLAAECRADPPVSPFTLLQGWKNADWKILVVSKQDSSNESKNAFGQAVDKDGRDESLRVV